MTPHQKQGELFCAIIKLQAVIMRFDKRAATPVQCVKWNAKMVVQFI